MFAGAITSWVSLAIAMAPVIVAVVVLIRNRDESQEDRLARERDEALRSRQALEADLSDCRRTVYELRIENLKLLNAK